MECWRCEWSELSRFGCCHQPWRGLLVLRAEKAQWVQGVLELADTYNMQFAGGGGMPPLQGWGLFSWSPKCCRIGCRHPHWMLLPGLA